MNSGVYKSILLEDTAQTGQRIRMFLYVCVGLDRHILFSEDVNAAEQL